MSSAPNIPFYDHPEHNSYALAELEDLPTLAQGQADNLKIDTGEARVWLCRCGVEDGMPYDNAVTVEVLDNGRWVESHRYPANNPRKGT
jgi:CDGSH-type Zn-finger protein